MFKLQTQSSFILVAILVCLLLPLSGRAFAAEHYVEQKLSFISASNQLSGALIVPKSGSEAFPVVIFVHGDLEQTYDGWGYYPYLWEQLAKRGIGAFSWDKAGIGSSSGNWQNQSMTDRANEVVDAIAILNEQQRVGPDQIGVMGFSQAGWVLPELATLSDQPAFMIFISTAVNWVEESDYQGEKRLRRLGLDEQTIATTLECARQSTERFLSKAHYPYQQYLTNWKSNCGLAHNCEESPMSAKRFQFVKLNIASDMRDHMGDIQTPILALFGKQDQLVDVENSVQVFNEYFSHRDDFMLKVFDNSNHSMLREDVFSNALGDPDDITRQLEMLGESAFADGFLETMATWVEQQTQQDR